MNKVPIHLVLAALLIIAGLVALVLGHVGGIVAGAAGLVVVVGVVSFWAAGAIGKPIRRLSETTKALGNSIEKDISFPKLDNLDGGVGQEFSGLTDTIQGVAGAFQKRLTELNSIHAITQTITLSTLDYEKTVKSVLAAVQQVVDYDAAEVAVLRGKALLVEAWWGKEDFIDTTGRKYRVGKGPTGIIAATQEPLFMPTVEESTEIMRTIGEAPMHSEFIAKTTKLRINSLLGIPLLIGERLIGTLMLVHHQSNFFTAGDMRQLNKLADHASVAIDNALQVREREAELKNQIRELKIEIDQAKLAKQVEEVTESEFFRNLQDNAAQMRERYNRGSSSSETEPTTEAAADEESTDSQEPEQS